MEKAIWKTLIYSDIFGYPLTIFEIHKWLINKKAVLRQVEKALEKLNQESRIKNQGNYYFLSGRESLVRLRKIRAKQSLLYIRKVSVISQLLRVIPWIKLVGISGGLSMDNAGKADDIDLFIITSQNRMWLSRILILGILSLTGQRRKVSDTSRKAAGKICCNVILEEDCLTQIRKNIYSAHEVLQMKVLWQRGGIYSKYLEDNSWAFKFLPNWVSDFSRGLSSLDPSFSRQVLGTPVENDLDLRSIVTPIDNILENLARRCQLKMMKTPQGMERIEQGALYFHPQDCGPAVLEKYTKSVKKLSRA